MNKVMILTSGSVFAVLAAIASVASAETKIHPNGCEIRLQEGGNYYVPVDPPLLL